MRLGVLMIITSGKPHIAPSVLSWLEQGHFDIVPISPLITGAEAAAIFDGIDGLYIHPGYAGVQMHSAVDRMAHTLLTMAHEAFKKGRHFPVWGTCYGFQQIIKFIGRITELESFHSKNYHSQMRIVPNTISRLFRYSERFQIKHISVPFFDHMEGLTIQGFNDNRSLRSAFRILGVASDRQHKDYVALIEGKRMPWYGCQFHPELHRPVSNTSWMVEFIGAELGRKMTV